MDRVEAITAQLKEAICTLDRFLTSATWQEVCRRNDQIFEYMSAEDFVFGELYYLSDGGYSRIFIDQFDEYKLKLASDPGIGAGEKWGSTAIFRERIESLVNKLYKELT